MEDVIGTAHEVWAVAQAGPKEGIADAVERIAPYLTQAAAAERAKVVKWLNDTIAATKRDVSEGMWAGIGEDADSFITTLRIIIDGLEALAHHEGDAG